MSEDSDCFYYARRAEEENSSGRSAADPAIAAIHFELSYRYRLLAQDIPSLMPHRYASYGRG